MPNGKHNSGALYVVAVPIGNPKDITLRALETLQAVEAVICEERRAGSTLLKRLGLAKDLLELNEHNEDSAAPEIVAQLRQGRAFALISDCGTPVFSDPGHALVRAASQARVPVIPIPGPASLMAALSVCDFKVERFLYEGFLPRDKDKRRQRLLALRSARVPVVLMDTPYRMTELLEEVAAVFGPARRLILACDLTLPSERIYRGAAGAVLKQIEKKKSEFVLVVR
jgi:16S rRNA (cytidine1402-2'-O)-methyltransferase